MELCQFEIYYTTVHDLCINYSGKPDLWRETYATGKLIFFENKAKLSLHLNQPLRDITHNLPVFSNLVDIYIYGIWYLFNFYITEPFFYTVPDMFRKKGVPKNLFMIFITLKTRD